MIALPFDLAWEPDDPGRSCYTCGRPPDGQYSDGSPSYHCVHPPVRSPAGWQPRPSGTVVTLNAEQVEQVQAEARSAMAGAARHGRKMKWTPYAGETEFDVKCRGFGAELAASLATGLPRNWSALAADYRRRDKRPDLGRRVEVKNTRFASLRLCAQQDDYDHARFDWYFLKMSGTVPTFTVGGWIRGDALLREENWDQALKTAAYCVPNRALQPLPLPPDA